jgi:ankyrin repeat protein
LVKLLLDNKTDVNAQGGHYGNALYAASERGKKETVQLLLDNEAKIDAMGGYYGSPLQAASAEGDKNIT